MNEYSHSLLEADFSLFAGGWIGTCSSRGSFATGLFLNAGCDRNNRSRYIKHEIPAGKFVIGSFVFRGYHLTEGLSSQLKTDGPFYYKGFAGNLPALVNLAFSVRVPDTNAGFANGRKNRILISIFEKWLNCFRILVDLNGIGKLVGMCRTGQNQHRHNIKTKISKKYFFQNIGICFEVVK